MNDPNWSSHPGWLLVITGGAIVALGVAWLVAPKIPWLGRLPGDIAIERENVRIYFPVVTCLLASAFLTLGAWIVRQFMR